MGVSGCGKSAVGLRLAELYHGIFHDADAYHPPENITKMTAKIPLTDADRQPWLARMRQEIVLATSDGVPHVLACSALKRQYRDVLRAGRDDVWFIYLQGSFDLILKRISARKDHYMKADLLRSQFTTLEEPTAEPNTITLSISASIEAIAQEVLRLIPT
jgi:gluconokinase